MLSGKISNKNAFYSQSGYILLIGHVSYNSKTTLAALNHGALNK